jgi:hypothetical protein
MADERFRAGAQSRTARAIAPTARDVPRPLATAPLTRRALASSKGSGCKGNGSRRERRVDLGIRTRASEILNLVLYQSELGQAEVSAPRGGPIRWPAGHAPRNAERADAMARGRNPFDTGVAGQRRAPLGSHQTEGRGIEPHPRQRGPYLSRLRRVVGSPQLFAGAPLSRRAAGPARVGLPGSL